MSTSDHSAIHTARNSVMEDLRTKEKRISEVSNPGDHNGPLAAPEPSLILTGKKLAIVFVAMCVLSLFPIMFKTYYLSQVTFITVDCP